MSFDTVPHQRLISKLKGYGITGNLLSWISDFLYQRTQHVNVNGNASPKVTVTSGVPQGSVLGPTLFVYYINDLPDYATCDIKIFADDTKIYSTIENKDKYDNLQLCINKLVKWTETWLLNFNSDKCKVLHIGKNNPHYEYHINQAGVVGKLDCTIAEKDLGVIVDPDLSFETHIHKTICKAHKISGMLFRFITNKSHNIMVPLYKALVRPILEYGNSVWCPNLRKHVKAIEDVQRRFTKRIVGADKLSYEERLMKFNLPSLEYRRLRGDLIEMYKIFNNKYDPRTVSNLFTLHESSTTRGHNFKIKKRLTSTKQYQCFFTNRVINFWNNLDTETANASSINVFKNRLDKKFKGHMYNTDFHVISSIH